jgi:excisionase family DNA binding protein
MRRADWPVETVRLIPLYPGNSWSVERATDDADDHLRGGIRGNATCLERGLKPQSKRTGNRLQLQVPGRNTIYEAIGRGEIPHVRIGRRILIPRAGLLRFLGTESGTNALGREGIGGDCPR